MMPSWLHASVNVDPVSLMPTAARGVMDGTTTVEQIGFALLAPVTLGLYRKR
jgi:ABC-2 type transport system permease protein